MALGDLREETFALVDALDGPGYNAAVGAHCRAAGFEPRLVADPQGPMAWETAVRSAGCVGLTTRSAAPATARDVTLLEIDPPPRFTLDLLAARGRPAARGGRVRRPRPRRLQRLSSRMRRSPRRT